MATATMAPLTQPDPAGPPVPEARGRVVVGWRGGPVVPDATVVVVGAAIVVVGAAEVLVDGVEVVVEPASSTLLASTSAERPATTYSFNTDPGQEVRLIVR